MKMKRHSTLTARLSILFILSMLLSACAPAAAQPPARPTETAAPRAGPKDLILSTTTSTQDSGLLDALIPVFEKASGYIVKTAAVGTGQALKLGEQCNADVLLVHAPASELDFMKAGNGDERLLVMHNDFIIVGPQDDPARIKGVKAAADALKMIADAKATFVSRADDSGTHKAELALWKLAGMTRPKESWYLETGQGMGATLKIASEKKGYTLTDRATYLANQAALALDVLVEKDNALLNVYHVITLSPTKCPKINLAGGKAFAQWIVSRPAQDLIGKFGLDKFKQPLFVPDAGKKDSDLGK
jgi:tungstate transport system substrate-binding protein